MSSWLNELLARLVPVGESMSLGHIFEGNVLSNAPSFHFLCFLATMAIFCSTPICNMFLPHDKVNGTTQPWTETSETVSQNKIFLL
jgi:hypothetical protein